MSAFMVSSRLMQKVVTAILQNTDQFGTIQTLRGQLVDDPPSDAQRQTGAAIGKRLFGMNATAIKARYGNLAAAASLQIRWLDRCNPDRAVQGNFAACSTEAARAPCPRVSSMAN